MIKICPECKKEFIIELSRFYKSFLTDTTKSIGKPKRFCSHNCSSRFHSRIKYNRLKDNPQFKLNAKKRFKKWIKKNRKHFNEMLREPNKIRKKKNYYKFIKMNLCVDCGKEKELERKDKRMCVKCAKSYKEYQRKYKWRKRNEKI